MFIHLVLVALIGLSPAADAAKGELVKRELEKAQGTWKFISVESSGALVFPFKGSNEVWKLDIKGDEYMFVTETDGKESRGRRNPFKCDPAQKPKTFDFMATGLSDGKIPYEGIYELEGDSLKLCYGLSRPKEFATKKGSGHIMMILKREKR